MEEKLKLKIQYKYADEEGKEKKISRTYLNIKEGASDETLLTVGREIEKLSNKSVEQIVKMSEKALN